MSLSGLTGGFSYSIMNLLKAESPGATGFEEGNHRKQAIMLLVGKEVRVPVL